MSRARAGRPLRVLSRILSVSARVRCAIRRSSPGLCGRGGARRASAVSGSRRRSQALVASKRAPARGRGWQRWRLLGREQRGVVGCEAGLIVAASDGFVGGRSRLRLVPVSMSASGSYSFSLAGARDHTPLGDQGARRGLSRSSQSLELLEDMTVGDNLRAASDRHDLLGYLTTPRLARPRPDLGLGGTRHPRADAPPRHAGERTFHTASGAWLVPLGQSSANQRSCCRMNRPRASRSTRPLRSPRCSPASSRRGESAAFWSSTTWDSS